MEVVRIKPEPVPPTGVTVHLDYQEARYLLGILNFAKRTMSMPVFRGTPGTFIRVRGFLCAIINYLYAAGVEDYK